MNFLLFTLFWGCVVGLVVCGITYFIEKKQYKKRLKFQRKIVWF